jgi:hypothetical protein
LSTRSRVAGRSHVHDAGAWDDTGRRGVADLFERRSVAVALDREGSGARAGRRRKVGESDGQSLDASVRRENSAVGPERESDAAAHRESAAIELDRRLRALSGRAARCRLAGGLLAGALLSRRGWQTLGFVRVGDYTSERLGLGARAFEEEARVARCLRKLPRITTAFLDGTLPWTALRLVAGVATGADEARWLEKAASLDTRALARLVRTSASSRPGAADGRDAEHEKEEGDPRQRWSVHVSRSGRRLWRAACELAQRTAGAPLTQAQVLEQVAAEAASSAPASMFAPSATGSAGGAMRNRLRAMATLDDEDAPLDEALRDRIRLWTAQITADLDAQNAEETLAAILGVHSNPNSDSSGDGPAERGTACTSPLAETFALAASSGRAPECTLSAADPSPTDDASASRPSLADLLANAIARSGDDGDRPLSFLTVESARELEERDPSLAALYAETLRDGVIVHDESHDPHAPEEGWFEKTLDDIGRTEGFAWLLRRPAAETSDLPGWLEAEFAALEAADPHTIDARLREVRRAAQALDFELAGLLREAADLRLYRHFQLPNLEAYVETRLGLSARTAWSLLSLERAIRCCCPLLGEAWRSGRVSSLAARFVVPVIGGGHGREWIARAEIVTLRRLEAEVAWSLNRRDEQLAAAADAATCDATDRFAPPPLDLDLANAPLVGVTVRELQMRARPALADGTADLTADRLQMRAQPEGADTATETATDAAPYRPSVQIEFFAPESVILLAEDTIDSLRSPFESRGRAFERMVALAMLEWISAPRHRDPVFERDGWRCAVPACRSRRNLHDHHLVFRSHGGDNARDNRVTACAAHHLHALHRGRIRASGRAPHAIAWEMGVRFGGGGAMAQLIGDRYVGPSARFSASRDPWIA